MNRSPLRVALITDAFVAEDGNIVDGVANTLGGFADYCSQNVSNDEFKLSIFTHGISSGRSTIRGCVACTRFKPVLPLAIHPNWHMDLLPYRRSIVDAVSAFEPDLIHIATPGSIGIAGLAAAQRTRSTLFGSYHTAYEENIRRRVEKILKSRSIPHRTVGRLFDRMTWRYVSWFYNHMARLVVPSEHTRKAVAPYFRSPVGIFSRGVDCDRFHPRFRRRPPMLTALHVGRMVVDKNLEALVPIFKDRNDVRLVLVGDGPEREWLEQALPNAVFTGHLTAEELSVAYASADLFVFPSETETFGNVALEAMASGLPVVTSDKMAAQELISNGENGFVGRIGVDFHHKVDALIRSSDLRSRMGSGARRFAANRSWHHVFESLIEDYRRTLQQPGLQAERPAAA